MSAPQSVSILETLVAPIPGASVAGGEPLTEDDLDPVQAALRSNDGGGGIWTTEKVDPNWSRVLQLTSDLLRTRAKDLRLACWYTEAAVRKVGLQGLTEGLGLMAELIARYWNEGLGPAVLDGDLSFRARAVEALNRRIPFLIRHIPLTESTSAGGPYSLIEYEQSQEIGLEKHLYNASGILDSKREAERKNSIAKGGVTGENWEAVEAGTSLKFIEYLAAQWQAAKDALSGLYAVLDRKDRFYKESPSLTPLSEEIDKCLAVVHDMLERRRPKAVAGAITPEPAKEQMAAARGAVILSVPASVSGASAGTWEAASAAAARGDYAAAVEEMTRLAAQEHGRNRFLHRLEMAQLCIDSGRKTLAIIVLEDLDADIKALNLDKWESPDLIGRVWGQLCRLYHGDPVQETRVKELYTKLCRLDPWQGYKWTIA